ncbi:MAG TPA: type IV pilus assembly protein PilM, partial [Candidatus Saccharimonadales bacterium]|nr:type IV pilus assembly protein PilM [Candidatus Saccharimonadales bacterium]
MNIPLGGQTDFFGLDIGTTALRAVQLKGTGAVKVLESYGMLPIEGTITMSDAPADRNKTAEKIRELVSKTDLSTKNVAVNIPSQKVFTAIVDMDKMSDEELAKSIRYQADSFIPTPLADSKIDWAILGDSPKDAKKVEVLLSSVPVTFVEARLQMLEAAGLSVVAIEPDGMALSRSIIPADAASPQMVLDIGNMNTDLVIVMNGAPRLVRAIPTGSATIVRSAMQHLAIDQTQAEQFVFKFGLSKDKLEGRVYAAIINSIESLMSEIEKSIKFFNERYTTLRIERIIVTGGASSMPE